jgi:hypothetical protein
MTIDPTKLFAQAEVCLFGWLLGQSEEEQEEEKGTVAKASSSSTPTLPGSFLHNAQPSARNVQSSGRSLLQQFYRNGAWIACIHAFSCEGRYTQFRTPALFLVTDEGEDVWEITGKLRPERFGLAHLDRSIEFAKDLKFWTYDRGAHIVRLDMAAGTVQRLVIDVEAGGPQGRRIDLVGQESTFMGRLTAGTP